MPDPPEPEQAAKVIIAASAVSRIAVIFTDFIESLRALLRTNPVGVNTSELRCLNYSKQRMPIVILAAQLS